MNYYDLDTIVELTVAFTAQDGVTPVDPTNVTIYVWAPDGSQTEYNAPTKVSTGVYAQDVLVGQVGPWIYKGQGTGTVDVTTIDTYFQVRQTAFAVTAP